MMLWYSFFVLGFSSIWVVSREAGFVFSSRAANNNNNKQTTKRREGTHFVPQAALAEHISGRLERRWQNTFQVAWGGTGKTHLACGPRRKHFALRQAVLAEHILGAAGGTHFAPRTWQNTFRTAAGGAGRTHFGRRLGRCWQNTFRPRTWKSTFCFYFSGDE